VGAPVGLSVSIETVQPSLVHSRVRPTAPRLCSQDACKGRYSLFAQYESKVVKSFVRSATLH
jgi:hypothetical protein